MYERSMKKLQRSIQQFLKIKPLCFAKIHHNAQILQRLQSTLDDYQRYLDLIQRAYFSMTYIDTCKARENYSSFERSSTDIGRVIHAFVYSSHATLCQDRIYNLIIFSIIQILLKKSYEYV